MEAVVIKIYSRSNDLKKVVQTLHSQGLKVIVSSKSEGEERCEEIIVYRELDAENC